MNEEHQRIKKSVLRNFIRICKENDQYYNIFKISCFKFYKAYKSDNPLHRYKINIFYLADKIFNESYHQGETNKFNVVMFFGNALLHDLIDNARKIDDKTIMSIGEEIFNRSCKELYKDEFTEFLEKQNKLFPFQDTSFETFCQTMFQRVNRERYNDFNHFCQVHMHTLCQLYENCRIIEN